MTEPKSPSEFLISLTPDSESPLFRQVYTALRDAILDGRLPPGRRLPSSRVLAAELGVGRNTVTLAFEQLQTEGYLSARRGGGTRVRAVAPPAAGTRKVPHRGRAQSAGGPVRLSARGAELAAGGAGIAGRAGTPPVPFRIGVAAVHPFPSRVWSRLSTGRWRRGAVPLDEQDPAGDPELRAAIAEHVVPARGVRCSTDQVFVVSGTQQALDLAARLLLEPGDKVWLEDPGYLGARAALRSGGAGLVPVPVDAEGLDIAAGERRAPNARMAFVTPSHQMPLGSVLSAPRRLALLGWARRADAWIFEDDYDSEFRYAGHPLPALQGLDAERRGQSPARVLYAGTFNKTLVPALRLGYLVVPEQLVDPLRAVRAAIDRQTSSFLQGVLADFITEGHYARHLRRMRGLYAERQEALVTAVREQLGGMLTVEPDPAGLHILAWLPLGVDDRRVAAAARRAGVEAYPLSTYRLDPPPDARGALLLGYAAFDPAEIRRGVRKLATTLSTQPIHSPRR